MRTSGWKSENTPSRSPVANRRVELVDQLGAHVLRATARWGEWREEAVDRPLGRQTDTAGAVELRAVMVLEREHQRDADDGARRDVEGFVHAVAVLDLAPRLGEAIHGGGEVLPVEALRHLRV